MAQTTNLTAANTYKVQWTYDRYGNRLSQHSVGGTLAVTPNDLVIDPATNRLSGTQGFAYDAAGNMTNDTVNTSIAYDAENRIKSIGGDSNYLYDGGALRVKKGTTTYIYSGAKVIAEYSGTTLSKEYVYFGGQLVATWTGSTNPVLTYQYADHLSLRAEADASGNISSATGHLPFGDAWYQFGTASKWKFTSYERDSTGLDYAIFRNNTSRYGRFMQPDKIGGSIRDPQTLNRFSYVRNNPTNAIDPFGTSFICIYGNGEPMRVIDLSVDGPAASPEWGTMGSVSCTPLFIALLQDAAQSAIDALKDPSCRNLFSKDVDPVALLQTLLAGNTQLGSITAGYSSNPQSVANTQGILGPGRTVTGANGEQVRQSNFVGTTTEINLSASAPFLGGYGGRFGASDNVNRAVTLIHELGHSAEIIYGTPSTKIENDESTSVANSSSVSAINSQLVFDNCFKDKPKQ